MKNMRTILYTLFISLLLCSAGNLSAQDDEALEGTKGFDKSRIFFGGNFGVSFGNSTFVNVSPQVGYRFNKWFAAGTGVNFIYSSFVTRDFNGDKLYKDSYGTAGLNIFGRVYPISQAFIQIQPEYNYTWGKQKYYASGQEFDLEGKFVPSFLVGAGAAIPAGRGAMIIMVQYDVIQDRRSPYGNRPFFSIGFNF
jgi:hypothetical protein